ncbi:hypothetical protein CVT24_011808 [Panaeolus cyanescens]|uniref:EF-hand domain-containing protein n=1 Tax=Panaeolus cyanescens TaxID=181874 RepID=A0A409VHA7_9AGAR|nr:hypothetical protein CVT24_011808 [Panaeolus cyanescens]
MSTGPPSSPPANATADNITNLYQQVVIDPKQEISSTEKKFDKFVERITTKPDTPALDFVNNFYTAHQDVFQTAAKGLISNIDSKSIDGAINSFQEASKIVMKGLDALGQAHPFISVAVIAFKLVVSLDLTRRENNKKVLALRVQMQDMMCVLFQLRNIKDPKEVGPDGSSLQDRFQGLMNAIADDIKNCGSACDVYMKKGVIARTIKSKIYESRLAGWGDKFVGHKKEIQDRLTIHTALGVDRANEKLDKTQETLTALSEKLDMMMVFRALDSPREREMNKFIEENGGAKAVIEDQSKLQKLVSKSGESVEQLGGDSRNAGDIASVQKSLMKELAEDIEELFEKNMALFGGKLNILQSNMKQESAFIIRTLSGGSHDRIRDADIKAIWKEMGWKGSVKARHFVLMLKDYFSDKEGFISKRTTSSSGGPNDIPITPRPEEPLVTPTPPEEEWALRYITISNLQPISEAVDDDGTGFINVSEVNVFAEDRPQDWSLLEWLAYWAAGYHLNVTDYRTRIYSLLGSMHQLLHQIKPTNRRNADLALDALDMRRLELILRGTRPYPYTNYSDSALKRLAEEYWEHELDRLEQNLQSVGYELDDPNTVRLVAGAGRIEKHFWPLVYLMLLGLHRIFKAGIHHTLSWREFEVISNGISSIFTAVDERVETLKATFQHANLDVDTQLSNFAFGMYRFYSSDNDIYQEQRPISENSLRREYKAMDFDQGEEDMLQYLKFPVEDDFQLYPNEFAESHAANTTPSVDGLDPVLLAKLRGPWTGHFLSTLDGKSISRAGLMELRLEISKPLPPTVDEDGTEPNDEDEVPADNGEETEVPEDEDAAEGSELEPATEYEDEDGEASDDGAEAEDGDDEGGDGSVSDEEQGLHDGPPSSESLSVYGMLEGLHGLGEVKGWYTPDEASDGSLLLTVTLPDVMPIKIELTVSNLSDNMSGEWHYHNTPNDDEGYTYDEPQDDVYFNDDDSSSSVGHVDLNEAATLELDDVATQTSGVVVFSRASALVYRHCPPPEEFNTNRIKALWSYAKAAVLDEVRYRMSPWKYAVERILEANDFIKLQYRRLVYLSGATPRNALTPEELSRLREHRYRMHPASARYFNALTLLDISRIPEQMGTTCDWCQLSINVQRSLCITCLSSDYTETLDLCPTCVGQCPSRDTFVHKSSHTLLRNYGFMHDCNYVHYVPRAKQVAKQTKAIFREKPGGKKGPAPRTVPEDIHCHYCKQAVKLPFWVCLDCDNDTYVCKACDIKQAKLHLPCPSHLQSSVLAEVPPPSEDTSEHAFDHVMIRIGDAVEEEAKPDTLMVIKETMDRRFHKLEDRVGAIDGRLMMFESMLTKIFTHITGAPPQPEMLAIPQSAKLKSKPTPIERSRSRAGRRRSIVGSEYGFKGERD